MATTQLLFLFFHFLFLFRSSVAPPASSTDTFTNPCGFLEDPIVSSSPPPPSTPNLASPPSSPPFIFSSPPPNPPPTSPPPRPPPSPPPPPPSPPPNPPPNPPSPPPPSPPPPSPPPPTPPPPRCDPSNPQPFCVSGLSLSCGGILPSFKLDPGVNYVGGNLKKTNNGSSASACAWNCLDIPGCTVFSHNASDGTCTFRNSSAVRVINPGFDSWSLCNNSVYGGSVKRATVSSSNSLAVEKPQLGRRLMQAKQGPTPQLWSNPSTWPGGVVPGIGSAVGANATIPCGQIVILDVANITLALLRVQGLLKFLDDPSVPQIYVKANYVLVEGQLLIGTAAQPYRQKAIFELTPAPGRRTLQYTFSLPAEPLYPRNLGHKAFVVVGGQVRLYGLPGPPNMPVWVRLNRHANVNDTTIQVDADVAGSWPVGGQIVVTSTDYYKFQTEQFRIVKVVSTGTGESIITLDKPMVYKHWGNLTGVTDGFGGYVDERAEVMLLTRNIVITGTEEPSPYQLEGGHFMIFMTKFPPQFIEGVEFFKMGQQGILGRYSVHFHIMGQSPQTVCRKNSIHQSKQRCIVIHASHNLTIDSNVAYNTAGHCFLLEEGGESNNTFINNIGAMTNTVSVRISGDETDVAPSTFWITNGQNRFIGNVAAGSDFTGFWFEYRDGVRGNSLTIPELRWIVPKRTSVLLFVNNSAHSNTDSGLRTYPHGMRPRINTNVFGPRSVLDGLRVYKNAKLGMFIKKTDSLDIKNSAFVDNGIGIRYNLVMHTNLINIRFNPFTENYGNPSGCNSSDSRKNYDCRPVSLTSCSLPLPPNTPGRSTGGRGRMAPTYGVIFDEGTGGAVFPNSFKNLSFANFDPTCAFFAALTMRGGSDSDYFNPANNVEGLKFSANTNALFAAPQYFQLPGNGLENMGRYAKFHMFYDNDGSLNDGVPAMILTNYTEVLPPGRANCTAKPQWNAYACSNVCYRTLAITYPEPNFSPGSANSTAFSYIKLTRLSDGQVITLDGSLNPDEDSTDLTRWYILNIMANQTYQLEVIPSSANPFLYKSITVDIHDMGPCNGWVTLLFRQTPNNPLILQTSDIVYQKTCPGVELLPSSEPTAQYSPVCIKNEPWIEVTFSNGIRSKYTYLPPNLSINYITLTRQPGNDTTGSCATSFNCSLIWSGRQWIYDNSGMERRPAFYNPILSEPANWSTGKGVFGSPRRWHSMIDTIIPNVVTTYYYRKTFTLTGASCYTSIQLESLFWDGLVIYLNNVEMLRVNLPSNYLDFRTNALSATKAYTFTSFVIPLNSSAPFFLVDGVNTIAIEQHLAYGVGGMLFDFRMSVTRRNSSCNDPQVRRNEVCDGLDNDLDGTVDLDPLGKPLTIPCSTICGTGVMSCINGYFQQCTAVQPSPEVCDGVDNDCDGIIDDGKGQLNCSLGTFCFLGSCLPSIKPTLPLKIWPRNATDWSYNDKGVDLDTTTPSWRGGASSEIWPKGPGPLGFDVRTPLASWQWFGTKINSFSSSRPLPTNYFAKSFTLSEAQLNETFNIDFSARRVDGLVVYLNGVEIWRDNMRPGLISASSLSFVGVYVNDESKYYPCKTCVRNNSKLLKVGVNYLVAEVHAQYLFKKTAAFDLDLYRNVISPCPQGFSKCVRQFEFPIFNAGSTWKYIDGNLPYPPLTWMKPDFNDSSWLSAASSFGLNARVTTTLNSGSVNGSEIRRTFYFRKTVDLRDGDCYVAFLFNLLNRDGSVLYINGYEIQRNFIGPGPVNSSVYAFGSSITWNPQKEFTGSYLKSGKNVFALELHRKQDTALLYFDMSASGKRDLINCAVDTPDVVIPWEN